MFYILSQTYVNEVFCDGMPSASSERRPQSKKGADRYSDTEYNTLDESTRDNTTYMYSLNKPFMES